MAACAAESAVADACVLEVVHSVPAKLRTELHDDVGVVVASGRNIVGEISKHFGAVVQHIPWLGSSVHLGLLAVLADAPLHKLDRCAPEVPFPSGLPRIRQVRANELLFLCSLPWQETFGFRRYH